MKELTFTQEDGFYVAEVGTNGEPIAVQVNRKYFPYPHDYSLEVLGRIDSSMPWAPVQMFDYKSPRNIIVYQNIPVDGYQLKLRSRTEVESAGYIGEGYSPLQELYVPTSIGGDTNPVLDEGVYHAYYVVKTQTQNRTAKLMKNGVEVSSEATVSDALTIITEQTVEAVPELAAYIGWLYDVVTISAEGLVGEYSLEYAADNLADDSLTFEAEDTTNYFCIAAYQNHSSVIIDQNIGGEWLNLEVSRDKKNWSAVTFSSSYPFYSEEYTLDSGESLYIRGNNPMGFYSMGNSGKFIISGAVGLVGDISTMISKSGGVQTIANCGFLGLFANCTGIIEASQLVLPATTLSDECYKYMFKGCYSLMSAPLLPATTLATSCYQFMFEGCKSLTEAPSLPATTLADYCYYFMFASCESLATAPALPATTLSSFCYQQMFTGCTSLTEAPALPATTLTSYCYQQMFCGCTSLTAAPELPATTLASYCYQLMFGGCTSLTAAPELPATTLAYFCYHLMFQSCTSLTSAPALPATTLTEGCYNSMFAGCTSLTSTPALPATTLATVCYGQMFQSCASLTSAPALPATTLKKGCYYLMFTGCTFAMSDDGTTFNFQFGATLPQTVVEDTFETHKDVATYMDNVTGFNE